MKFWHMQLHPDNRDSFTPDVIKEILTKAKVIGLGEGWPNVNGNPVDSPRQFTEDMNIGDIVLVRHTMHPIALVEITTKAWYAEENEIDESFDWFPLRRGVKVLGFYSKKEEQILKKALAKMGKAHIPASGTLGTCSKDTATGIFITNWLNELKGEIKMKDIITLLTKRKNIIIQGAPGTGKTYSTSNLAVGLLKPDFLDFDNHSKVMEAYKNLFIKIDTEATINNLKSKGAITSGQIGFITFHQSLEYEDFVEGIKPISDGTKVSYVIENGIFKMMARKAKEDPDNKYILIIDEINRGNISKILGELITLIEPDKRELVGDDSQNKDLSSHQHTISVILPYSKEAFTVPSNLYIIGTMNTTDRSIGNIDYAIRRRFDFITLESDKTIVESNSSKKALILFNSVQKFIENNKETEFDIADLRIGHSYFLVDKKDTGDELEQRWKYEILPLLRDYYKDGIITKDIPENCRAIEAFENFVNE